jgi:hypothetical protein
MKDRVSVISRTLSILALFAPLAVSTTACAPASMGATGAAGTGGGGGGAGGGGGGMASCGGSSGTSDKANWTWVSGYIQSACAGADCHENGNRQPFMIGLDDATLYSNLMTYTATGKCGSRRLINPCFPEESAFYVSQQPSGCGAPPTYTPRMPFGCVDLCTFPDELEGIRQWILNGAPH